MDLMKENGSASDRQATNFSFAVWRAVSYFQFHNPQEVLLAQLSQCVFFYFNNILTLVFIRILFLQSVIMVSIHVLL